MVTGILQVCFILHECQTLKEKRSIVKRIVDRTRNRFNAAVAEVACLDACQRGELGIAVVSNDKRHANSMLDQIVDFIEGMNLVDITDVKTELLN